MKNMKKKKETILKYAPDAYDYFPAMIILFDSKQYLSNYILDLLKDLPKSIKVKKKQNEIEFDMKHSKKRNFLCV